MSRCPSDSKRALRFFLPFLLAACIARLWLMPLPSSFWLDELFTAFLVQVGASHPSLAVAPHVVESIYYFLPRLSVELFGSSLGHAEVAYRLPSVLAMAVALFLIARLAARLIHPQAGWFAAFACLGLSGINYYAADARPYALGICIATASFLFLLFWLDSGRWRDALLFVLFAALLWRVHLIYWPLYTAFALYACVRLSGRKTKVEWLRASVVFAALGATLLPVFFRALAILPEAGAHAFAPVPPFRDLLNSFKLGLVAVCGIGAWLFGAVSVAGTGLREQGRGSSRAPFVPGRFSWFSRWLGRPMGAVAPSLPPLVLVASWWLLPPLSLFTYSHVSGNGVFLYRYLSVALPGAALAATFVAGFSMPAARWKLMAGVLGTGVLLSLGQWQETWPRHDLSDWRAAADQIRELNLEPDTPVVCPSPILEARPPAWNPDYELPGFLYAHLQAYPIPGTPYLLPFEPSPEAVQYAAALARQTLVGAPRFLVYGWDGNARFWRDWFARRPELASWRQVPFGPFGNVSVVLFEREAEGETVKRPERPPPVGQ